MRVLGVRGGRCPPLCHRPGAVVTDPVPRLRICGGALLRDGYDYGPADRVACPDVARESEGVLDNRSGGHGGALGAAFDPRRRIQRDPFNELVVFVVSAAGACVLVPVLLLIVGAFTGEFGFLLFVALSVVLELGLIFLHARPAMTPRESVAWAVLWGVAAAVLGAAFWELVFAPVLS